MKYSIAFKFIAITLCALFLLGAIGSALGIFQLIDAGLYTSSIEEKKQMQYETAATELGWYYSQRYASSALGKCPETLVNQLYGAEQPYWSRIQDGSYALALSQNGKIVWSTGNVLPQSTHCVESAVSPTYAKVSGVKTTGDAKEAGILREQMAAANSGIDTENANPAVCYSDTVCVYSQNASGEPLYTVYSLDYYQGPVYEVSVYFSDGIPLDATMEILEVLYGFRNQFIAVLLLSILLFAAGMVYLCCVAGRKAPAGDIHPAGLNRLPLDLYFAVVVIGEFLLLHPLIWYVDFFRYPDADWGSFMPMTLVMGLCVLAMCLLVVGLIYCFAAQSKVPGGFWWRHTVAGWLLHKCSAGLKWVFRSCRRVFLLLPVIWQWLLIALTMMIVLVLDLLLFIHGWGFWQMFWGAVFLGTVLVCIGVVCYGAYCFGTLLKGTQYMSQGYLNHQIPTTTLAGPFRVFARYLNSLAGAAQMAAAQQMKSERMKTELITNVSHDIKTPLTSIINYVDLLKKPHTEMEGTQYLEVLDRQSHRLKKLIDDLMEMSKASTGNIHMELGPVDAVEAVNQALGEFADKLDAAELMPVFHHPEEAVTFMADGRLVWRVLSNLLSNAVKYSLPGTRLYLDLTVLQGNGILSIKNVSRDQLNVDPADLMERFVRGDTARNTEGSGLGLNIAKSLVELQHGQMHLMVDGDLFKVTMVFPLAG